MLGFGQRNFQLTAWLDVIGTVTTCYIVGRA